jgi:hypothetical protein
MKKEILFALSITLLMSAGAAPVRADCMKAYENELASLQKLEETDNTSFIELQKMRESIAKGFLGSVTADAGAGCLAVGAVGFGFAFVPAIPGCIAGAVLGTVLAIDTSPVTDENSDQNVDRYNRNIERNKDFVEENRKTIENYRQSIRRALDILREARDYPQGGDVISKAGATSLVSILRQGNSAGAYCDRSGNVAPDWKVLALASQVKSAEANRDPRISSLMLAKQVETNQKSDTFQNDLQAVTAGRIHEYDDGAERGCNFLPLVACR